MTIDEAIEDLTSYLKDSKLPKSSYLYNATLLGIEALKRVQLCRGDHPSQVFSLLPGETEE